MQNIDDKKLVAIIIGTVIATGLILSPALTDQVDAQGQGQAKKAEKVKTEKAKKEKDDDEKVKPDKAKEEKVDKNKKKPKTLKQTRFEVIVDGSQVGNLTDALLNYEFTVAANGLISKAKMLELGNETDDISNMQIVFNAKGLTLVEGDTFTAMATALNEPYLTDTVTGTFSTEDIGQSGKTRTVGLTDEPLVLSEIGQTIEEQIPDDFGQ